MATTPTQIHPSSTLSKTQRRYTGGYMPGQGIHVHLQYIYVENGWRKPDFPSERVLPSK